MTPQQQKWLDEHPNYQPVGKPRPDVCFSTFGTLYADGTFEPSASMKPIILRPGCFGVGVRASRD